MPDKPPSNDLLIRCIILLAVFAPLIGVIVAPWVQGEDLTDVALCMVVPFTLARLFFGYVSSEWAVLSVIQVFGLAGAEFAIYKVSARFHPKWSLRLLAMVVAWVLVTTITNIPVILLTPAVSA